MSAPDLTTLINLASGGDRAAETDLMDRVYDRLRAIAAGRSAAEKEAQTLHPTVLVHEAYLKLFEGARPPSWDGRNHFFGAAARAMRQIAVDHARRRNAQKRGGGWARVSVSGLTGDEAAEVDLLDLDEALHELGALSERQAQIVELRFFGGLTTDEVARMLDLSPRTVQLEWRAARAWLRSRLIGDG